MKSEDKSLERWGGSTALVRWEDCIAESTGHVPPGREVGDGLYALMHAAQIQCHGGGSHHAASICVECERYVEAIAGPDRRSVTIRCWWHRNVVPKPSSVAEGSGMLELPPQTCASCGECEFVAPHPRMPMVGICPSCLEVSLRPLEPGELGGG